MKQIFRRIVLAAAVFSTSLAAAPPPAPEPSPATSGQLEVVQTGTPARPAMWQVRDADTTIYLFGTIHALPQGIDWFGSAVAAAFDGSHELVRNHRIRCSADADCGAVKGNAARGQQPAQPSDAAAAHRL